MYWCVSTVDSTINHTIFGLFAIDQLNLNENGAHGILGQQRHSSVKFLTVIVDIN
jgi:hypothetical protein